MKEKENKIKKKTQQQQQQQQQLKQKSISLNYFFNMAWFKRLKCSGHEVFNSFL